MSEEQITIEQVLERIKEFQQANAQLLQQLAANGVGIEPFGILATKLEALIDTVMDSSGRALVELNFEAKMNEQLEKAMANSNKVKLLQGVDPSNLPPNLLVPGQ